jgi:Protein of unknown function (DUF2642)
VRWDALFTDLEARAHDEHAAELAAEVADRTRVETASLHLVDRLRPTQGHELVVSAAGATVRGVLRSVGPDWILIEAEPSRQAVVRLAAVLGLAGVGARSSPPDSEGRVVARLALASALRAVARDRAPVTITLIDGSSLTGTLDRIGADFAELAEHPIGEPRRVGTVTAVRLVPFRALGVVSCG